MNYETERLLIRPWQESDRDPFAKLNTDPRVMEYFPKFRTREESDSMIDLCNKSIAKDGFSFWAVDRKDSGEFIGFVGISRYEAELPFCPCVEIGWRLAHKHWGQGFATEAAKKCLAIGFEQFNLKEIVAFTAVVNKRSQRVMSKIGMTNTGHNFAYPSLADGHVLQEHCLYRCAPNS